MEVVVIAGAIRHAKLRLYHYYQTHQLNSDTVVDISPISTPSPQKFPRPHPIPISFNPILAPSPFAATPSPVSTHPHEIHPRLH